MKLIANETLFLDAIDQSMDYESTIGIVNISMDLPEGATHLNSQLLADIAESVLGEIEDGSLEVVELHD